MKRARRATKKVAKPAKKSSQPPPAPGPSKADSFPIVGIGASAGGLEAFKELLASLPEKAGMAYVLVPHLDPAHHSVLTEILSRFTKISIAEVMDGTPVERDRIYVIPPNKTLGISGGKFALVEREATHSPHLPIDYFLTALANAGAIRPLESSCRAPLRMGRKGALLSRSPAGSPLRRITSPRNTMTCRKMRSGGKHRFCVAPQGHREGTRSA